MCLTFYPLQPGEEVDGSPSRDPSSRVEGHLVETTNHNSESGGTYLETVGVRLKTLSFPGPTREPPWVTGGDDGPIINRNRGLVVHLLRQSFYRRTDPWGDSK